MSPAQGAHNLRQRAEQLAAILPPLLVAAERVAATVVQGVHGRRRVGQGEVIGYVGSSGLATASHLDYRVQRNGSWIDPLSIKSVPADPVQRDDMPEFITERDRLRRALWEGEAYDQPTDGPRGELTRVVATATAGELGGG